MGIEHKDGLIISQNENCSNRNYIYNCGYMHSLLGREEIHFEDGIRREYYYRKNAYMNERGKSI